MIPARPLFRQEVIEFQRQHRQWGEIALPQPVSTKVITWASVALVGLIVGYLAVAQYARKETVVGYLAPTAGTAKIFVPRQGTIEAIHVEQGQPVVEGQPLLTVTTQEVAGDGEDVNAAKLAMMTQQRALLTRQIAAEEQRTTSEHGRLSALIGGLETAIAELKSQIAFQNERRRLSESLVTAAKELTDKGYMAETERKRRQEAMLGQRQNVAQLMQQLAELDNQLVENRFALEQLPTVMAAKIQVLRASLSDTEQKIAETKGRRALIIRTPIAGRVASLQATVGRTTDPKDLQLEVVPADSSLRAELFVPTRAAGFISPGQSVRVLYDAFPYQKFGTYSAQVVQASQTILTASDVSGPIALKEPAYRVIATLGRPDVDAYGKKMPLQAGMLLHADIILERRSLLHWMFDPLLSARM